MTATAGQRRFARIDRLPPYVFNITAELRMAARRRGEDIIDMSMGNPDGPTPKHVVDKLVEVAQRGDTHGLSVLRCARKAYQDDPDPAARTSHRSGHGGIDETG